MMQSKVVPSPCEVMDMSREHDASLSWTRTEDGLMHVSGFNSETNPARSNHACVNMVYELDEPGAIAYGWKVQGGGSDGAEIFDRYWYLEDGEGLVASGADFLGESDCFSLHVIDGLDAGTYKLTLGVFCLGRDGMVTLDLGLSA